MLATLSASTYRALLPYGALLEALAVDNATWPDTGPLLAGPSTLRPIPRRLNPTEVR